MTINIQNHQNLYKPLLYGSYMTNQSSNQNSSQSLESALETYKSYREVAKPVLKKEQKITQSFVRTYPEQAQVLAQQYDEIYNHSTFSSIKNRINHFGRELSDERKAEIILEDESDKGYGKVSRFIRKHPKIIGALIGVQGLVSAMSPTHPIAVDAYLASKPIEAVRSYFSPQSQEQKQAEKKELEDFLTSKESVERYRSDFIEDVKDSSSEKAFVIVRNKQGKLEQKPVRTLHENLPEWVPNAIRNSLDRHCITRLGDMINIERESNQVVANGHYHVFGEMPSLGDNLPFNFDAKPKIVVRNYLIPFVYINGELPKQDFDIPISRKLHYLTVTIKGKFPQDNDGRLEDEKIRIKHVEYFLDYFRKHYGINPSDYLSLRHAVEEEWRSFWDFKRVVNLYLNKTNNNCNLDMKHRLDNFLLDQDSLFAVFNNVYTTDKIRQKFEALE